MCAYFHVCLPGCGGVYVNKHVVFLRQCVNSCILRYDPEEKVI